MVVNRSTGELLHRRFAQFPDHVEKGAVMVLNKTRVINARIHGTSVDSGGQVEFILLRELQPGLWKTLAAKARKQRPGRIYRFPDGITAEIVAEADLPAGAGSGVPGGAGADGTDTRTGTEAGEAFRYLRFKPRIDAGFLETHGHVPLPPYIRRPDTPYDAERYQTVYADDPGSAAAPTAGLHLTRDVLEQLERKGVNLVKITLHVGAGTFLPIRSEQIEQHRMHEERYRIPEESADQINAALREGRTVLAVGTTVVRALESAFSEEVQGVVPGTRSTSLFIRPGYRFRVVSHLLTNFHTPRSSLLVLVSAFAGRERILRAYETAVREDYRFFSYGDAMLIL